MTGEKPAPASGTGQPSGSEAVGTSTDEVHDLFLTSPAADDDRGEQEADLIEAEEEAQIEAITVAAESGSTSDPSAMPAELWKREQQLLDRMQAVADRARHQPDAKTRRLIDWVRKHMCPSLPPFGAQAAGSPPRWNERRVLIFTENREGTKRYLKAILEQAIEGTDRADDRIEVIDGLTQGARRKEIQRRFNADPATEPLRILLATDAAREGLNFQAHCADLFHFDLPWNPGRIEQRNGRIDRKLQPAPEVRCHYIRAAAACRGPCVGGARPQDGNDQARARQPVEGDRRRRGAKDAGWDPPPGRRPPEARNRGRGLGPGQVLADIIGSGASPTSSRAA